MTHELLVQARELVLRESGRVLGREEFAPVEGLLDERLQRLLKGRSASAISVRVASSYARMLLLPWLPQLNTPERWNSLAMSRFEQAYGEAADNWVLRVADDMPPRSRLAVALPAELLRALSEALKPRRIVSGLLEAFSALLAREPAFHGCAAEIGPDSASLLMVCRGELRRLRSRHVEGRDEILAAVRSEWAAAGAANADPDRSGKPTANQPGTSVAVLGGGAELGAALASALGCSRVLELA